MERDKERAGNVELTEEAVTSLTDRILFAVKEGNEYRAMTAAQEQIELGMPGYLSDDVTEWKYYLVRILTLLTDAIVRSGSVSQYLELRAERVLKQIDAAKTQEECQELLLQIVKSFCSLQGETGRQYSVLVQRIMEQVAIDLTQPLTLQYFADKLNVNSSYLSNLFRQQTGVTITEYVTEKRIRHAATLLGYTRNPIKMVAKLVGIPDVQYFSRLFKRRMGVTPTQYREEMDKERMEKMEPKVLDDGIL